MSYYKKTIPVHGIYYGGCSACVPLDTHGTMISNHAGDDIMTTKETIRAIRKETGLSQAAFGTRFGIPKRTIQDWEAGLRTCPAYVAEMLEYLSRTDYHTPRLEEES